MPEIPVSVRGRQYDIACTEDEHEATVTARDMLDHEMQKWVEQEDIGIPHLLIMCALSFADQIRNLERQAEETKDQLEALRNSIEPEPLTAFHEIDQEISEENYVDLAELADFAEEIAAGLEESFGISNEDESDPAQDIDDRTRART